MAKTYLFKRAYDVKGFSKKGMEALKQDLRTHLIGVRFLLDDTRTNLCVYAETGTGGWDPYIRSTIANYKRVR